MRSRNLSKLVLVVAVAMAFALGSLGTATASGLSKGAVKKIAAKVVKKQAPTLSVAHATTADTASTAGTLQGSTANQLKTTGYTYALPAEAAVSSRRYSFPGLPVGTYLASYNYNAFTSAVSVRMQCQFEPVGGGTPYAGTSTGVNSGSAFNRATASVVLTTTPTTDLYCVTAGGTYTFPTQNVAQSSVSFTRIDIPVSANATASAARRLH
jgi:hypothetical protein